MNFLELSIKILANFKEMILINLWYFYLDMTLILLWQIVLILIPTKAKKLSQQSLMLSRNMLIIVHMHQADILIILGESKKELIANQKIM